DRGELQRPCPRKPACRRGFAGPPRGGSAESAFLGDADPAASQREDRRYLVRMKATAPLAVLAASVLLMGGALFIRSAWNEASSLVARGVAASVASAGQDALRDGVAVPDQAALQAVLTAHDDEGLVYLAVLDDAAKPLVQVGRSSAVKPPAADGGVEVDG